MPDSSLFELSSREEDTGTAPTVSSSLSSSTHPTPRTVPQSTIFSSSDLLNRIISLLPSSDLYRCLLVSRSFYSQAGPALYRTVILSGPKQVSLMIHYTRFKLSTEREPIQNPTLHHSLFAYTKHLVITSGFDINFPVVEIKRILFPHGIKKVTIGPNGWCDDRDRTRHSSDSCPIHLAQILGAEEIEITPPTISWYTDCYESAIPTCHTLTLHLPFNFPYRLYADDLQPIIAKAKKIRIGLVPLFDTNRAPDSYHFISDLVVELVDSMKAEWEVYMLDECMRDTEQWYKSEYRHEGKVIRNLDGSLSSSSRVVSQLKDPKAIVRFGTREEWNAISHNRVEPKGKTAKYGGGGSVFTPTSEAYVWPGPNAGDGANQHASDDEEEDDDEDDDYNDDDDDEDAEGDDADSEGGGIDGKDKAEVEKLVRGKGDTESNDDNDEDHTEPVQGMVPETRDRAKRTLANIVAQSNQGSKDDKIDMSRKDEPKRHVQPPNDVSNPRPSATITSDSSDEDDGHMKSQPQTWPKWGLRE